MFIFILPTCPPPPQPIETSYLAKEGLPGREIEIVEIADIKKDGSMGLVSFHDYPILPVDMECLQQQIKTHTDKTKPSYPPAKKQIVKAKSSPPSINRRGIRESKQPNKKHLS